MAAGTVVLVAVVFVVRSWLKIRGIRVITCPETGRKAGVELDAAIGVVLSGSAPRLSSCTRWPEKQNCGQECLREIAETGENCLARTILAGWYTGKACASCGAQFGEIDWSTRKPGLLTPDGRTIDWAEVPAEHIDAVLATHKPVCFTCHVTTKFIRQHPDLIVDRSVRAAGRTGA